MTTSGRPSWLDRAVDEALTVCPTVAPWEMRLALIAAAPTIQAAATEAALAEAAREFESGNEWCQRALAAEGQVAAVEQALDIESWVIERGAHDRGVRVACQRIRQALADPESFLNPTPAQARP